MVGELGLQVADHAPVDDVGEVALEDAPGFLFCVPAGACVCVDACARGSQRSCVIAIRYRIALMRRLPPGL